MTLCGPRDNERLTKLGADHCFDYHDPECGRAIWQLTNNNLRYAWDTIANETSAHLCADALSTRPGTRYGTINPMKSPREDVESTATVMYTAIGEAFDYGSTHFPASSEDFEFAKMFMSLTETLLAQVRDVWYYISSSERWFRGSEADTIAVEEAAHAPWDRRERWARWHPGRT